MRNVGWSSATIVFSALVVGCAEDSPVGPPVAVSADASTEAAIDVSLPLGFEVADPVGDNTGPIDVIGMEMSFDDATGDYEITLTASGAEPFMGDFRVNINLLNVDDGSFFQDAVNDFSLTTPTTNLVLSGTHATLTSWDEGDRVHTNNLGGFPPFGLFRSSASSVPFGFLTNEDYIAFLDDAQPAVIEASDDPGPSPCPVIDPVHELLAQFEADGKIGAADAGILSASLDVACKAVENGRKRRAHRFLQQFLQDLRSAWDSGAFSTTRFDVESLRDAAGHAMGVLRGVV